MNKIEKMEQALDAALSVLTKVSCSAYTVEDLIEKIKAARAMPKRQCDVGTAEEQIYLHREWCKRDNDSSYCCNDCRDCFARWAQMPYEAQEGAGE